MTHATSLDTYVKFNSTLEYLGISLGKIEGKCVRVIDFTDENQMVRAGERVVLAVSRLHSHINSDAYTRNDLAQTGEMALKRLCVTSYPHLFSENIPAQLYFQLPELLTPETSTISKIYQLFMQLLSTLVHSLSLLRHSKRVEDLEMKEIQLK